MGTVHSMEGKLIVFRTKEQIQQHESDLKSLRRKGAARANTAKQRAARKLRIAAWANKDAIRKFYEEAERLTRKTKILYEVDHIIPLLGVNVSGLHVENNLRVITKRRNRMKSNRFDGGS